ncbi:hypothetical protein GCM10027614_07590 [Micromonospora vulcania]
MTPSSLVRPSLALLLAAGLSTLVLPAGTAQAATATTPAPTVSAPVTVTSTEQLAPGVTYGSFQVDTPRGATVGYLLTADLRKNKVSVGLLHPDTVAQRQVVSAMTNDQGAVAGVNGDFFNISETHAGVEPTGSASGPEIADGQDLKFAVPTAQRFGPGIAPGTSTRDVFGVGVNGKARVDTLSLTGEVRSARAGSPSAASTSTRSRSAASACSPPRGAPPPGCAPPAAVTPAATTRAAPTPTR